MSSTKNSRRLRTSRKNRAVVRESLQAYRLTVTKSNQHIYAQMFANVGSIVIASASTSEKIFSQEMKGNNIENSKKIGQLIAQRSIEKGVKKCAFDRSGYPYHGKIKALADAARNEGLEF